MVEVTRAVGGVYLNRGGASFFISDTEVSDVLRDIRTLSRNRNAEEHLEAHRKLSNEWSNRDEA